MFQMRILLLCCLFYVNTVTMRYSVNALGVDLMRDLQLTPQTLSSAVAAYLYAYALSQIPLGMLLDRYGVRRVVVVCNLLVCMGILLFSTATGIVGLLAGQVCMGLGVGTVFLGSFKLLATVFPPGKLITIIGLLFGMAGVGGMLASSPLALLASVVSWRVVYLLFGALHLLLLFWFFVETRSIPVSTSKGIPFALAGRLLRNRHFWVLLAPAGLRYGVYGAMQGVWLSLFLMLNLGLDRLTASNLLLLFFFSGALSGPLTGYLTDFVFKSRKGMAMCGLAGMGICVLICAFWPHGDFSMILLGFVIVLFGFFASINSIFFAQAREFVPPEMTGLAVSILNFVVNCVAAISVQVLGMVVAFSGGAPEGYRYAFCVCAGMLALAVVIYAHWKSPTQTIL